MKLYMPSLPQVLPTACLLLLNFQQVIGAGDSGPSSDDHIIKVPTAASLIHLGSLDSFDVTSGGTSAARLILNYLEKGDKQSARDAIDIYNRIIPDENFGGEYTALKWLMECELAPEDIREKDFLADPYVRDFRQTFAEENWKPLKSYLTDKYHLDNNPGNRLQLTETKRRNRYLEDYILFANPMREAWEKSSKFIAAVGLKPGDKVADIGSGPGYFSYFFAKIVGDTGKVYAVDNNEDHVAHLTSLLDRLKIKNIQPVMPKIEDMAVPEKVDVVYMCSLYHNMYSMFSDGERNAMVAGIKAIMKKDGRLFLVDNGLVEGRLPYHGPYISRELIIAQFQSYGFDLTETHQFIPQRYMLVFKLSDRPFTATPQKAVDLPPDGIVVRSLKDLPPTPGVSEFVDGKSDQIRILTERSLVHTHMPGIAHTFSTKGRAIAAKFYEALQTMDLEKLKVVDAAYQALIPLERIGDDYTALQWFCRYLLAPSEVEKGRFIANPLHADYFNFFAEGDYRRLRLYLKNKYVIGELEAKFAEIADKEEAKNRTEREKLLKEDTPEARAKLASRPVPPNEAERQKLMAEDTPEARAKLASRPLPVIVPDSVKSSVSAKLQSLVTSPDGKGASESSPPSAAKGVGPPPAGANADTRIATDTADGGIQLPRPPTKDMVPKDPQLEPPPPPYQELPLDVKVEELISWWEFMNFSNPRREEWEKTSKMMDFLDIKPGQRIADVGSGGGYYTFKFADRVGPQGKVYALDMAYEQLQNVHRGGEKSGFHNIEILLSKENDCMLPENSIDMAYLCSLYHATYVHSMEYVKDQFIASIKKALKPGGRLVIVDNEPLSDHSAGYYGPHIAKELIISQIEKYGLKFKAYGQFIPQRYMLVFEVEK